MEFNLEQAIEILGRTPAALRVFLEGLPSAWAETNEGPGTWSPYDIIGHLIHADETDWLPRAQIILEHGDAKPFEPFDRFAQFEKSKGKSLAELLGEFESLRAKNVELLREMNVTPEKLALRGAHPELGEVTLAQLLSTWVVHDLSHVAQAARVMCKQYSEAVGPWKQFLPILD